MKMKKDKKKEKVGYIINEYKTSKEEKSPNAKQWTKNIKDFGQSFYLL